MSHAMTARVGHLGFRPPLLFILSALVGLTAVSAAAPARAESAAVPYVSLSDLVLDEGQEGMTPFAIEVRLLNWSGAITVDIAAQAGSASAADFVFATTRVTLVPNETKIVNGFIVADRVFEGDEVFDLRATAATGDGGVPYPGWVLSTGGRVTIRDDDGNTAPQLSITGALVREGDVGTAKHEVTVRLDPPSAGVVTVDYATMDQSTAGATDYVPTSGTLTFAPGEIKKIIDVEIKGDTLWEGEEVLNVLLTSPRGAILTNDRASLVIQNDDPEIEVTADDVTVIEGTGGTKTVPVTFHWTGVNGTPPKILVSVVGGSATPGLDHEGEATTLYPLPADTSVVYPLLIQSDATPECDEGIVLQYFWAAAASPTQKQVKVLIKDDDGPPPSACPDSFGPSPARGDAGPPPSAGSDPHAPVPDAASKPADAADSDANINQPGGDAQGAHAADHGGASPADDAGGCAIGGAGGGWAMTLVASALAGLALRQRRRPHRD
jgi:hypothetical protein